MSEVKHSRVYIIGSGPGGQLTPTTDAETWPGETAITGPDLMARMAAQAEHVSVERVSDLITSVDLSMSPFRAVGNSGITYLGDTLVIATGAPARWPGLQPPGSARHWCPPRSSQQHRSRRRAPAWVSGVLACC